MRSTYTYAYNAPRMALDHYGVLQVSRYATSDEIKAAYHQAALRLHPDKLNTNQDGSRGAASNGVSSGGGAGGGAVAAAAAFQALQDAWQVCALGFGFALELFQQCVDTIRG